MSVREEYFDKDKVENQVYYAVYEVSRENADSERGAIDYLWDNEIVFNDVQTSFQRIAAESTDEGAYYEVKVVFSAARFNEDQLLDTSETTAVEIKRKDKLGQLLKRLGF